MFLFSILYGCVLSVRNLLFNLGIFQITKVDVPVVSVGNLSVGGTGKTPIVLELAEFALKNKLRPIILTRGYKSGIRNPTRVLPVSPDVKNGSPFYGDEPQMLKMRSPLTEVVVCPDRVAGARWALQNNLGNFIILDDGFQHRWLHRDLDILAVDATEKRSLQWPVPFGRAREFSFGKNRADALLFTKTNLLTARPSWIWTWKWQALGKRQFVSDVEYHLTGTEGLTGFTGSVLVVSALAKSASVIDLLKREGYFNVQEMKFADHHLYGQRDIDAICARFKALGGDENCRIVTTEKDAIKLDHLKTQLPRYVVVQLKLYIQEKRGFDELLHQLLF